jgi:carboxylate-amine ligase
MTALFENNYGKNSHPLVGVEIEFQIIDDKTFDLSDKIGPLMEETDKDAFISPEAFQSSVELKSLPVRTTKEAKEQIQRKLFSIVDHLEPLGIKLCSLGIHPFSRKDAKVTDSPRYVKFEKDYPFITKHHLPFSTHIHVSMDSTNEAISVMKGMRTLLPIFMTLSASSPYWQGEETGFVSFRQYLLRGGLNAGIPPYFLDWEDFTNYFKAAIASKNISTLKDIHWDVRPRPDLGTIELRVMDAVPTLGEAMALASFAYCTMHALKKMSLSELLPEFFFADLPDWADRDNHLQANHLGIHSPFIRNSQGDISQVIEIAEALIKKLDKAATELGEEEGLAQAQKILQSGPPYERIQKLHEKTHSFREIVKWAAEDLSQEITRLRSEF